MKTLLDFDGFKFVHFHWLIIYDDYHHPLGTSAIYYVSVQYNMVIKIDHLPKT